MKKYNTRTTRHDHDYKLSGLALLNNAIYCGAFTMESINGSFYVRQSIVKLDTNGDVQDTYRLDTAAVVNGDAYFFNNIKQVTEKGNVVMITATCFNAKPDTALRQGYYVGYLNPDTRRLTGNVYTTNAQYMNMQDAYLVDTNSYSILFNPAPVNIDLANWNTRSKPVVAVIANDTIRFSKQLGTDGDAFIYGKNVLHRNDTVWVSGVMHKQTRGFITFMKMSNAPASSCDITDVILSKNSFSKVLDTNYTPAVYNSGIYTSPSEGPFPANDSIVAQYICGDTTVLGIATANNTLHDIKLYPNPSTSTVTIDINAGNSITAIVCYDMTGRQIQGLQMQTSNGKYLLTFPKHINGHVICSIHTKEGTVTKRVYIEQ